MRLSVKAVAAVLVGAGLVGAGVPAFSADGTLCSMGGTMVKIAVDKGKALDWAKDRQKAKVTGEDTDAWTILTPSRGDRDIALFVTPSYIFFGVAGRDGREVDPRDAEKLFGRDLKNLKEVVKKEMGDIWKANIVKMGGDEVAKIADAVGLGMLEKGGRDWELKSEKCRGMELDTSGL